MMYLAGLLDSTRIEQTIWAVTIVEAARVVRTFRRAQEESEREAGKVIKTPPRKSLAGVLPPIHTALIFLPLLGYAATLPFSKFVQPKWMANLSLPSFGFSADDLNVLRLAGLAGMIAAVEFTRISVKYLGRNNHPYGVRERPTLSSKGPFSVVSLSLEQGQSTLALFPRFVTLRT
jgi:hypothetical protein